MNYHSGRWTENNKNSLHEHKRDNTQATIPRCYFMFFFYVFKMAVAIAFLCKNAVEAVQFFFSISMILSLNCFYSILQRNTVATAIFNA